jgi:cobalt/nickel transport system permease protein
MLSQHIPDPDLITSYSERQDSFFSRVSPWTKFAGLILVILTITLTRNLFICAGLYGAVLAAFILARLPVKKLFAWYALPVLFVLSLVGIVAWSEPGIPLFSVPLGFFSATLTDQGVILVLTLTLKALISVTYSLFFVMTTRYQHFSAMIYRIFPSPLDQIFLMAYRFLFLTLAMTGSMLKAVRSRGGGLIHSIRVQGKLFAEVFALVFIRSFERAERVHKAMLSRGYSGSLAALTEVPRPRPAEVGFLSLFVTAIAIMVWLVPNTRGV